MEVKESWVLQPDVCRCCLSGKGTRDMKGAYISDTGIKQVFTEILQDCFNIKLSLMNEMDCSHLICDVCVRQLCDTSNFHKQVLNAEKLFVRHYTDNNENTLPDLQSVSEKSPDKNIKQDTINLTDRPTQKHVDINNDSTELNRITLSRDIKNNSDEALGVRLFEPLAKHENIKQVSERRQAILTCNTVLLETTACPFRHHKSWFQCFYCTKDFMDIDSLRNHTTQMHSDPEAELKRKKRYPRSLQIEISNLECRHCCVSLTDVDTLTEHFVRKHNKVVHKEYIADFKIDCSPFTCHICNKEFHVFRTLTTHLNEHYAYCICDICGKSFLNTKRLKVHKKTHENGTFPCTLCGKVLKTKSSHTNHMESHTKRKLKCQICFEPMKHYNDRVKHMSEVHDITNKFKCTICNREYNIKHYLATHIRQTHGSKNKKCTLCNMAFITNHSLKKHMSKHTGERPFKCSICSKSYARSYTLKEHMRTHEKCSADSK